MSSASIPRSAERTPLDLERVVDAAIALADEGGLDAVSMRRLADDLGVTAMALYKHVAHRDELLDRMVDRLIDEFAPVAPELAWQPALRGRILSARAALGRHSWAQSAIETRTMASPAVLGYMDSLMAIMFAGGFSADLVHHAMHALSTRMWGLTRDVMPTPALPEDPEMRAAALASFSEQFPSIVRMATTAPHAGRECDDDAEFAFALDILLDAFAHLHAQGWSSAGS